jgi:hypothetical protein
MLEMLALFLALIFLSMTAAMTQAVLASSRTPWWKRVLRLAVRRAAMPPHVPAVHLDPLESLRARTLNLGPIAPARSLLGTPSVHDINGRHAGWMRRHIARVWPLADSCTAYARSRP